MDGRWRAAGTGKASSCGSGGGGAWLTRRAGTSKAGQTEGLGRRASRRPKLSQNHATLYRKSKTTTYAILSTKVYIVDKDGETCASLCGVLRQPTAACNVHRNEMWRVLLLAALQFAAIRPTDQRRCCTLLQPRLCYHRLN